MQPICSSYGQSWFIIITNRNVDDFTKFFQVSILATFTQDLNDFPLVQHPNSYTSFELFIDKTFYTRLMLCSYACLSTLLHTFYCFVLIVSLCASLPFLNFKLSLVFVWKLSMTQKRALVKSYGLWRWEKLYEKLPQIHIGESFVSRQSDPITMKARREYLWKHVNWKKKTQWISGKQLVCVCVCLCLICRDRLQLWIYYLSGY